MRPTLVVIAGLALLLAAAPAARADVLHASTFSGTLVEIETTDASSYVVGTDGTSTRAAAFDLDGTLYTTVTSGRSLGIYDLATGAVTVVGPMLSSGVMDAIEIDATGQLVGIATDGSAYLIDKTTGTPTLLSNVGIRNIQDLAYDPDGNLWGVSGNGLYLIDMQNGVAQLLGTIGGDRQGNVYGISFDAAGHLWATATVTNAPLYEIDLATLAASLVGYTGIDYPRGCDIYVAPPPPPAPEEPQELPPLDTDGDGYPDEDDAFPESDLRETVWVGEIDTGVPNTLFEDGSTIADLVGALAADADHAGQLVRGVTHLCISLRQDGWITGAQQGAIVRAAAKLFEHDFAHWKKSCKKKSHHGRHHGHAKKHGHCKSR